MLRIPQRITAAAVLALASSASFGQCRTVPAPGGGYMTECPSQAPRIPPPAPMPPVPPPAPGSAAPRIPPGNYAAVCNTAPGTCVTYFPFPPATGSDCSCSDSQGNVYTGSTSGPSR